MTREIGGVHFSVKGARNGLTELSVAKVSADSAAIEFIVEAVETSWSSEVTAARPEYSVTVPQLDGRPVLRVRLFDEFGRELNRKSSSCFEIVGNSLQLNLGKPPDAFKSRIVPGALVIASCFLLWSIMPSVVSKKKSTLTQESSRATLNLAVLARSANLRSAPAVIKGNILSALPFGTKLVGGAQTGDFLEVQVFGGEKGYIHRDVVGDSDRVQKLGLKDSLQQARSVADDRREAILATAREVRPLLLASSLFDSIGASSVDSRFRAAVARTNGDDVAGWFYHYLAEEAAARQDFKKAVVYFRAAAISNPLSVADVHGWGVTQLRDSGFVEETSILHAAVLAPRSTNTWLMVAGYIASSGAQASQAEVASALRLAIGFSSNRKVTRRFFSDLAGSTSNFRLKRALNEVKDSI